MPHLIGIDLGTSSVRALLVRDDGAECGLEAEKYDISIPRPRWAEQDPRIWWEGTVAALRRLLGKAGVPPADIAALSFSGQMHGLVCLGEDGDPVRPAIIWPDQRSAEVIADIHERLGRDFVAENTQNAIATGFLAASLLWLAKHEPESYARTMRALLPKDYIKYRLSGVAATDFSDAAGSLAFDNINLRWAEKLLARLGLDMDKFPPIAPCTKALGNVTAAAAEATGLSTETLVVNGGADQAMQAIGNGIVGDGVFAANIGTGGQVSTSMSRPVFDPQLRTSTFAHAIPGRWYIMGATLSSGASMKWLANNILDGADFAALDAGAAEIPPGSRGVVFLPYLSGERTPHLDPRARAMFFGLNLGHNRFHMARAVMEGVVFSFRDCLEIITGLGLPCKRLIASGGGAGSELWLQIQADILGHDVYRSLTREQASFGAAITAGVGAGVFRDFGRACADLVKMSEKPYHPREEYRRVHEDAYGVYRELYSANRDLFRLVEREPVIDN